MLFKLTTGLLAALAILPAAARGGPRPVAFGEGYRHAGVGTVSEIPL